MSVIKWCKSIFIGNLVGQILVGIITGIMLSLLSKELATQASIFGRLFVSALKAIAPVLVFVLVAASIASQKRSAHTSIKPIIQLYLLATFIAAVIAVIISFLLPVNLTLATYNATTTAPNGIGEVLGMLLFKLVDNPVQALATGNFIGILVWAIALGAALCKASDNTKQVFIDIADGVSAIVKVVIRLAPIGIFGLVAGTFAQSGWLELAKYSQLISLLLLSMLIVTLLVNPLIVFYKIRKNPYPLIFKCLKISGIPAFFTRSSAANIPVNIKLCKDLKLDKNVYSIAIPLGATMNMAGAAITITILTMAAVHTLGIEVDFATACLLSIVAAIAACGVSGIAGGSLLLIPLACSLFGIPNEVAAQVIAVGFIISVVQDSVETALNSSTDVVFTAAICQAKEFSAIK